jgi:homospermidine synthase
VGVEYQFSFLKVDSSSCRLLVIGCGSVSQCTLPLLIDFFLLKKQINSITIIDATDQRIKIQEHLTRYHQIQYHQELITKTNYEEILKKYLSKDDILLDLAYNIETRCLLKWCHDHQICFVNTSVELWNPFGQAYKNDPRLLTLYHRQMQLIDMQNDSKWKKNGPTAILDHGCNPGLVSHFVKRGLIDMTHYILQQKDKFLSSKEKKNLENALETKNYPQLAYLLGIKTIHISERDTQLTKDPKKVNEFVNTWSIEGLVEEGAAPAEMGWGTHERNLPNGTYFHNESEGPCNQICLATKGMNTKVNHFLFYSLPQKLIFHLGPFMGTKW